MKILFAEDDMHLGRSICQAFKRENCIVDWYQDGISAEQAYKTGSYDIFILDVNLPRKDGFSIIASNKKRTKRTPIICLTELSNVPDRVKGLNAGADDYLPKPFEFIELKARMSSVIRRNKNLESFVIEYRDLKINIDDHMVYFKNEILKLPYKEFALLKILMLNKGRTLTRESIMDKMYSDNEYRESNILEAHIYNLRKIIDRGYIRTVRSVGYIMG